MPNDNGKKKKGRKPAFSELSKEEQLKRARAARAKAGSVLKGPTRSNSKSERAGAFKAQKAAERVETRLTGKAPIKLKTGPPPPSLGDAARSLVDIAKTGASLPGKLAEGFDSTKETSRNAANKKKKGIRVP